LSFSQKEPVAWGRGEGGHGGLVWFIYPKSAVRADGVLNWRAVAPALPETFGDVARVAMARTAFIVNDLGCLVWGKVLVAKKREKLTS
jgi:hypothetical protein